MSQNPDCRSCAHESQTGTTVDRSLTSVEWASIVGVSQSAIRRHWKHSNTIPTDNVTGESEFHRPDGSADYVQYSATEAWGYEDFRNFIESKGQNPDSVTFSWGVTSRPGGGYWNKLNNVRPVTAGDTPDGAPEWPVIQQATRVNVVLEDAPAKPARNGLKLSLKCADPQIGFRAVGHGYEEFHDRAAMNLFVNVVKQEQPEAIAILGDFLDLPSQGKYVQEAGFARTTQMAIDAGHEWLSVLRAAAPDAEIVLIEGNHDKRMQNFIEQNALAAFGLRRANMPDAWPVMSMPYLLRLEELNIQYQDAYPAAVHWDDDTTRNIHGTRANSKGSTMAQYSNDLPHINTWAGHTHRTEIIYKTVMGARGVPIETYSANPGCLARVDGAVPSVHGAIHADGSSAKIVEDWQQGFGSLLFDGTGQSWPQVHRIRDGVAIYNGRRYVA